MGEIKDGIDLGIEVLQFWQRFKGKRVRVWPSELTIRVCSESGRKWVTSAEGREPHWWAETRKQYLDGRTNASDLSASDTLVRYAADELANSELPNIQTVEDAKLFEATISDITRNPPGIFLTNIQYWLVVGDAGEKRVVKVDSTDEGMLLPLTQFARIDFVSPGLHGDLREKSSWAI